uniref:Uncharacterized protein n=1 Tax=Ditylum brightwellii TaxID=49249 RepID=A0A6V2MUS5_9STRA
MKLTSILIPEGVEVMGNDVFMGCAKLVEVEFPSTLKRIGNYSFCECQSLRMIRVPEGVEEVGGGAFYSCVKLEEVELPYSLKNIGEGAFEYCESLTRVTLPLIPDACNHFRKSKKLTALTFLPPPDELPTEPLEGNTLLHRCAAKEHPLIHIIDILEEYPNAIKQTNILGQTPLHLCLANNVSTDVTKLIYDAWPGAVDVRNERNKTPFDYWRENGEDAEIGCIIGAEASIPTASTVFVLAKEDKAVIVNKESVFLRGNYLLLEILNEHNEKICTPYHPYQNEFGKLFLEQLQSRNLLFGKLLSEFSNLIDFSNQKVIQQAAAVQALCFKHLNTSSKNYIDFQCFSSAALWYQQEILSLVMRVYCEDQRMDELVDDRDNRILACVPSAINDAKKCKEDLEKKNNSTI